MKDKIMNHLLEQPNGLKASQLAKLIGTDRKTVNQYLYGQEGKSFFEIDSNYIWRIKKKQQAVKISPIIIEKKSEPFTPVVPQVKSAHVLNEYRYLPQNKGLFLRSVFWVYQNKTYYEEKYGGFLWSPKYTINGKHHPGYESMKQVKPGDIIIHSFRTNIVAISVAKTYCYSFDRPPSFEFSEWSKDGWKIECEYFELPFELSTDAIGTKLHELQPKSGPFFAPNSGKQQYLCHANKAMLDWILNGYIAAAYSEKQIEVLLSFLKLSKLKINSSNANKTDQDLFEELCVRKVSKTYVEDGCKIGAVILDTQEATVFTIDTDRYPKQKHLIGKTIGDDFSIDGVDLKYKIKNIWLEIDE